ncbi:hypothetical protein IFM89_007641 [Coptis chinensis]|uniref:Uncharacterized protein n=1 Tax=Coptis chinensis TaxID=261450 RepID=A0A835HPA9_9MAGN|nr:hypothetical protein IFM89_007641 [Coptis chinensis]
MRPKDLMLEVLNLTNLGYNFLIGLLGRLKLECLRGSMVQPENHVNPPPLERHPGQNRRTCPLGKGEGRKSKKSKQSAETNETNENNEANETNEDNEANEVEPQNVDNNEGEPQVNDIPITTRGGGRRGRDHNVNVHEVVNEPEVHEVVNDIPRATRGGRAGGRVGGTTGGRVYMSAMGENNTPVASSDEVISQKKQNSDPVASIHSSGVISQKKQKTGPKSGLVGHHGPSAVWNHFAKQLSEGTNKYSGTDVALAE